MSNFIKNCRLHVASWVKKFVVDQTDPDEIRTLMRSLHPIYCDKQLIRMGSGLDGGYLVPDDLDGIEFCFSPGVAESSVFEHQCAERGMEVYLADFSVEKPPLQHERFHFTKKYVGITTNDTFITLDDWVNQSVADGKSELLLQIDIEGFEFEVFMAASDPLMRRFRIIVAEFHRLDHLWSKPHFKIVSRVFEKILQTHSCVHAHPNNGRGLVTLGDIHIPLNMEFTFLRKDRIREAAYAAIYPHPLDADNISGNKPLMLPPCWYRSSK